MTIGDLKVVLDGQHKDLRRQYKTAFKQFSKTFKETRGKEITDATPLSDVFNGNFKSVLEAHLKEQRKPSYNTVRQTHLYIIQDMAQRLISSGGLHTDIPLDLRAALIMLWKRSGKSRPQYAKDYGIPYTTFQEWTNTGGKQNTPSPYSFKNIEKIERKEGLPPGTLTNLIPRAGKLLNWVANAPSTAYGINISELKKLEYALQLKEWPEHLKQEWKEISDHKTSNTLSKGIKRNKKWRKSTSNINLGVFKSFFGFCSLPKHPDEIDAKHSGTVKHINLKTVRVADQSLIVLNRNGAIAIVDSSGVALEKYDLTCGAKVTLEDGQAAVAGARLVSWDPRLQGLGIDKKDLTFALLSDSEVVIAYLKFCEARSGEINTYAQTVVCAANVLTNRKYGYLTQNIEFADRLPQPHEKHQFYFDDEDEEDYRIKFKGKPLKDFWKKWCSGNNRDLRAVLRGYTKDKVFRMTRDPEDPIRNIIALDSPMDGVFTLIARMEADRPSPTTSNERKAVHYRDLLLIVFLAAIPLRISHYQRMLYNINNTCHLYRRGAHFGLRYKSYEFKNADGAAKDDYDVAVPEWVTPYIENYLIHWRHFLKSPNASDHVFLVAKNNQNKYPQRGEFENGAILSRSIVRKVTAQYLRDLAPTGFSAHVFRHIRATDELKKNPEGFVWVAHILHDKIETVIAKYNKLKVGEAVRILGKRQNGEWERWRAANVEQNGGIKCAQA